MSWANVLRVDERGEPLGWSTLPEPLPDYFELVISLEERAARGIRVVTSTGDIFADAVRQVLTDGLPCDRFDRVEDDKAKACAVYRLTHRWVSSLN